MRLTLNAMYTIGRTLKNYIAKCTQAVDSVVHTEISLTCVNFVARLAKVRYSFTSIN